MVELLVFRALWGMTGSLESQLEAIAADGYDGVEAWHDPSRFTPTGLRQLADSFGLKLIVAYAIPASTEIAPALDTLASYDPIRIGVHSGRDSFTESEGNAYFEEAIRVSERIGVPIGHETHRGRLLYTPWATAGYLKRFPGLRIVADFSHWVNVCERLPDDQAAALELTCQRTSHIHGRVGYEEGPQVPDPAAPEYKRELDWHETQWKRIAAHHVESSQEFLTFTPEYGPPRYLHTLPYTDSPVADLRSICLWAANRARETLG